MATKTIKARFRNQIITVHVLPTKADLPHTARFAGCIAHDGFCYGAWRCEGEVYTVL